MSKLRILGLVCFGLIALAAIISLTFAAVDLYKFYDNRDCHDGYATNFCRSIGFTDGKSYPSLYKCSNSEEDMKMFALRENEMGRCRGDVDEE